MAQHHYLPRFYLKGFSAPPPPRNEVWVHHPEPGWERRPIKDTAAEAGYYTFTDDAGQETEDFERFLGQVENSAATVIRAKIPARTPLTDEERMEFALFIATMVSRVPGQRNHIGDFMEQVAEMTLAVGAQAMMEDPRRWEAFKRHYETETGEKLPDEIGPKDIDPSSGRFKLKAHPQASLALSFSSIELESRIIYDKNWRFLVTKAPVLFITSDFPVGIHDPTTEGTIYGPALAAPETEVTLPLSKTIALLAVGRGAGTGWLEASDKVVAQVNTRTMMRASFLVSSTPSAHGLKV